MTSIRRLAALVLALTGMLAGCGGGTSGSSLKSVSLVLDWYPNSDHGGLYTAMQRGYFARRGLHVQPYVPSDTSAQIKLVAAGRADFGISYETDLLAARAQHIPVESVMCIVQHPLDTVMSLAGEHIKRPRDLAGKTVGMAGSPSDVPLMTAMMRADGSSISRVHMVNVGYNLRPALLAHRVDAVIGVYWTWEAIEAEMSGHPVNVLRVERWGVPNYCELVLVASQSTVAHRPAVVRDMVQGMQEGYVYAEAHPAVAFAALHSRDHTLSRGLVERSIKLLRSTIVTGPMVGYQSPTQWKRYGAWLARNHLIAAPVNTAAAFTNRFLSPRYH